MNFNDPFRFNPPKGLNNLTRPQLNVMEDLLGFLPRPTPSPTTADYSDSDLILPENESDYNPFGFGSEEYDYIGNFQSQATLDRPVLIGLNRFGPKFSNTDRFSKGKHLPMRVGTLFLVSRNLCRYHDND